jgi:hypothetical protein
MRLIPQGSERITTRASSLNRTSIGIPSFVTLGRLHATWKMQHSETASTASQMKAAKEEFIRAVEESRAARKLAAAARLSRAIAADEKHAFKEASHQKRKRGDDRQSASCHRINIQREGALGENCLHSRASTLKRLRPLSVVVAAPDAVALSARVDAPLGRVTRL